MIGSPIGNWLEIQVGYRVGGIERRVLIGAVAERVLQIVVNSGAGSHHGLAAERAPRQTEAWLRQVPGIVPGERTGAHLRLRIDHAIREGVIGRFSVRFVPAARKLFAESQRKCEFRAERGWRLLRKLRQRANAN